MFSLMHLCSTGPLKLPLPAFCNFKADQLFFVFRLGMYLTFKIIDLDEMPWLNNTIKKLI